MNLICDRKALLIQEIIIRLSLFVVFEITEEAVPFHRKILPEEMWLYSYPRTASYYPSWMLWTTVLGVPMLVFLGFWVLRLNLEDLVTACLGLTFAVYCSGIIVNLMKLTVGRPRPDFLARCYPDGISHTECTGDAESIKEGYKSFPSGHSVLAFSSLSYTSFYLAGKLHVFSCRHESSALKVLAFITPLMWATIIAISRTADYHHHWQDVTVGSLIGLVMSYIVYRQGYPDLTKMTSHLPYSQLPAVTNSSLSAIISQDSLPGTPLTPSQHAQNSTVSE